MWITYTIADYAQPRHGIVAVIDRQPAPWSAVFASECDLMVPGTVDPEC